MFTNEKRQADIRWHDGQLGWSWVFEGGSNKGDWDGITRYVENIRCCKIIFFV